MASNIEIIQEAVKRGLPLPPEKQALYDEAVKRGLIQDSRVGVGEDMAKAAPSGLVRGTIGLANTAGGIASAARNTVGGWLGITPEQMQELNYNQSRLGMGVPSRTGDAINKVEEVTGPLHKAQTIPGQYTETAAEFAPGMLVGGGSVPSKVAAWLLGSTGSETAGQMSKGEWYEPYARFAGGLLGSLAGGVAGDKAYSKVSGAEPLPVKQPVKELDELQTVKNEAYKAVDNSGLQYSPSDYSDMLMNIYQQWGRMKFNPGLHNKVAAFIDTLKSNLGKPISLTQLDQLRQQAFRDVINGSDEANAAFGKVITKNIDDMIENVTPNGAIDPSVAANLMNAARSANTAYKSSESILWKLDKASRQANKTGKGTNQDNTLRQKVDELINEKNGGPFKRYSKDVQAKMREIVDGTTGRNTARYIGQAAPTGAVSTALGGGAGSSAGAFVGGLLGGPAGAAAGSIIGGFGVPAIGQVAKMTADRGTRNAVDDLLRIIQAGGDATKAGVNVPSLLGQNIPNAIAGGNSAIISNRTRSRPVLKR